MLIFTEREGVTVALRPGQVKRGEAVIYRAERVTFVRSAGRCAIVCGDVVGGEGQVPWDELKRPEEFTTMVEQHPHEQL